MTKQEKDALIKALTECPCSGFVAADLKTLEAMSDDQLTRLKARSDATAETETKLKAAEAKPATEKIVEKELTQEEMLAKFPSIKALVDRAQATEAARKAELVTTLKAAQQAYSEDELKALDVPMLEKIAQVAKVNTGTIDYSGRALATGRTATTGSTLASFEPPDPYAAGLKQKAH